MIDKDNQHELSLIADILSIKNTFINANNEKIVFSIAYDAIEEALSSADSEEDILFILQHYPPLTHLLLKVVSEKHPAHLDRLNKLIVLT